MDDLTGYTPSDDEVRECFVLSGDGLDFKRVAEQRGQAFDRWRAGLRPVTETTDGGAAS